MASPDCKPAEVLWERSSLAALSIKGLRMAARRAQGPLQNTQTLEAHSGLQPGAQILYAANSSALYNLTYVPMLRLYFSFSALPFFFLTNLAFLLITKHKKVVNIFSLCFYPVTINIFAKIKAWIHPQMRSCCFPASVSKYGP